MLGMAMSRVIGYQLSQMVSVQDLIELQNLIVELDHALGTLSGQLV